MVGVIVDGAGDYAAIGSRFKGRVHVLKATGPRGHTVSGEQLARSCHRQVSILVALRCSTVVIMTDFEERREDYAVFCQSLQRALEALDAPVPLICSVANRMIENWYLADAISLSQARSYIRNGLRQKRYEGMNGKSELKRLFVQGITYNEIRHGKELMNTIRLDVASANSLSFQSFLTTVGVSTAGSGAE